MDDLLSRRTVLARGLIATGLMASAPLASLAAAALVVANVTQLYTVSVARIVVPQSAADVSAALADWPGRVAVGGARYSMGGQIAVFGGLHLDMRAMNRVLWVRAESRTARVQAGTRWRDLQDVLDPLDLAVKTMQSYSNFSVGGSVSVNAHGRYVGHGPVGHSVRALQLVLADGSVVETSRTQQPELFKAAIGGYGAIAVITEVELDLAPNVRIERVVAEMPLAGYIEYFDREVIGGGAAVLHNADLMPPLFDRPVSVTWRRSDKPLTQKSKLVLRGQSYALQQNVLWLLTELPGGEALHKSVLHPLLTARPEVKWLNHEASLDAAELEPRTRRFSTYVLQEYFIPRRHFEAFARDMASVLRKRGVEALNVSIRHSPADQTSLLPWAHEEVFSFVLYYKQRTHAKAIAAVGRWTRELIDLALTHEGRYYLPYQLHATPAQFGRAYPEVAILRDLKAKVDPRARFSNELWARYLNA